MDSIKHQFKKESFVIFNDYIENIEQEILHYQANDYNGSKKLWLKNVDLSIIQSKISDIEFKEDRDYESNKVLNKLQEKEHKIKQIVEE